MHRFFAPQESFSDGSVSLDEGETRHLRDSLRTGSGEHVLVFDGKGGEFECRVERIGKRDSQLTVLSEIEPSAPESKLNLIVAAALTPQEKFDLVVQKCVELGVHRFIPIVTGRTEARVKDQDKKLSRLRRISFEAAKQCGRATLMEIDPIIQFNDLMKVDLGTKLLFSERDGQSFSDIGQPNVITAIFGPKGGWDNSELDLARSSGALTITLGGRILRAETAAISITAIIQHRFGDMN